LFSGRSCDQTFLNLSAPGNRLCIRFWGFGNGEQFLLRGGGACGLLDDSVKSPCGYGYCIPIPLALSFATHSMGGGGGQRIKKNPNPIWAKLRTIPFYWTGLAFSGVGDCQEAQMGSFCPGLCCQKRLQLRLNFQLTVFRIPKEGTNLGFSWGGPSTKNGHSTVTYPKLDVNPPLPHYTHIF